MASKSEREYIIAISIDSGIITLIEPNGSISNYRQRGIQRLPKSIIATEIKAGNLNPLWEKIPELPRNYSIEFEDPEIMGRALATYPGTLRYLKKNGKK